MSFWLGFGFSCECVTYNFIASAYLGGFLAFEVSQSGIVNSNALQKNYKMPQVTLHWPETNR